MVKVEIDDAHGKSRLMSSKEMPNSPKTPKTLKTVEHGPGWSLQDVRQAASRSVGHAFVALQLLQDRGRCPG